jgi:hypothetical protein
VTGGCDEEEKGRETGGQRAILKYFFDLALGGKEGGRGVCWRGQSGGVNACKCVKVGKWPGLGARQARQGGGESKSKIHMVYKAKSFSH